MDAFLQYLLSIEELTDEKRGSLLLEKAFRRVDEHRRVKAAGMRPGRGQAASLGAGLLLQLALGEIRKDCFGHELKQYTVSQLLARLESMAFFPASYRYGDKGKPCFRDYPYCFSLSHSGDYVYCVISQKDIGADIQQWRKCDVKRLSGRFFSYSEREALERAGMEQTGLKQEGLGRSGDLEAELFFRLWARKEAYGKLTGRGIGDAAGVDLLPGKETAPDGRKLLWTEKPFWTESSLCMEKQLGLKEYGNTGYSIAVCQYDEDDSFPKREQI